MRVLLALYLFIFFSPVVNAAESASAAQPSVVKSPVVPAYQEPFSADAILQLVVGLAVVVFLIFGISWLFRRFSGIAPVSRNMRVLGVMPLGTREKAVLVQVGGKQILLGVAPGRVSHLQSFDEPVIDEKNVGTSFASRLTEAVQRQQGKKEDE
ncbi:flagellar biosynthetic protein FliO [Neptuniibacter sp.]|uniref:flagellar biosynthetic protein FliO n=1 Tax=Neptuniibacter sp. TaxID=1962643 RepID=UPI0026132731|nr:flagellar biosynthetic protein FliO [Neptuniibacter sp.]MCP4596515.1 flagellar biosynthetic protein FliO [Neptuniibacter sp.]